MSMRASSAPLEAIVPTRAATVGAAGGGGSRSSSSASSTSSLLRIISVAICFVLAFHWYLVLHHVTHHAPRGHLLLPERTPNRGRTGSGGDAKKKKKEENDSQQRYSEVHSERRGDNDNDGGGGEDKGQYVLSPVCGGCYRSRDENGVPCYDSVQSYVKKHSSSRLREALAHAGRNVAGCEVCDPDACYERRLSRRRNDEDEDERGSPKNSEQNTDQHQTKYWRFDQTSPRLDSPTSVVLSSIPSELRIPPSRFDDIEAYIKAKYANPDPANTTNVFLMEYNPGIAPIPVRMRAYLPWNAKYLLSLRVTPHNFCFPHWLTERLSEDQKQTMHSLNHMGLALLDERYRTIPGHDVVIDIDRQLEAKRIMMGEPAFVDYRLFNLNDELYLHINSDTVILAKLRLRSKGINHSNDEEEDLMLKKMGQKQIPLKNLYGGDQFEVTLVDQFKTIWGEGKDSIFGKNYALFSVPNVTHPTAPDAVYAEMSVHPNHMVMQILPDEYDKLPRDTKIKWRQRRNFKIDYIVQRKMRSVGNATRSSTSDSVTAAVPSFFTADEHWFPGSKNPFKEFVHGGACCVSLSLEQISEAGAVAPKAEQDGNWEGVESVLVGVGHTLVKFYNKKNLPLNERFLMPDTNYVSFLYAFDPRPPFQLLARSGYFCLGFASTSEDKEGGPMNPRSILTHNRPLSQNNETFACAQIHYVSSIIEKLGDPSKVVVGYGMNDCTARLVEVSKKEIVRLLFPDPWDMVMSKKAP